MPEQGIPFSGNSPLFEYPLGQCLLYFNGFLLGKTTSDTILKVDRDIKDIMYSQDGTKASDWVNTGELYSIEVTFGETNEELISQMDESWVIDNVGNALLGRNLYESYRQNRAKELKLVKVDGNGAPIAGDTYTFNFYEAIPVVNGEIMQFGADTQKNLPVVFNFGYKKFLPGESTIHNGGYGYIGDATVLDVPAIEWPPIPQSSEVTGIGATAGSLDVVFDRNIEFPTGAYVTLLMEVTIDGTTTALVTPANVTIATTTITADLATAAENLPISPGQTVTVNILALCIQGESDNKAFPYVTKFPVTNSVT